jgi:hypothetical protein
MFLSDLVLPKTLKAIGLVTVPNQSIEFIIDIVDLGHFNEYVLRSIC